MGRGAAKARFVTAAGGGYDVFISYSRSADERIAIRLQAALGALAKPWYQRRAIRVFRDQTSLSVAPELWPAIERALEASRYFVLLASPEAAASLWVSREVEWWRRHRSPDTFLIALTGGTLAWDDGAAGFTTDTNAIPRGVRDWLTSEPLWTDLRWASDRDSLTLRDEQFRSHVADLAATARGIEKDDLIGEDIRQHRRVVRLARASVAALVLLALAATVAAVIAVSQRNLAVEQGQVATTRAIAASANASAAQRLDVAQLLAAEAETRRPSAPETRAALLQAVTASPHLARFAENGAPVSVIAAGDDAVVTGAADGSVRVWNLGAPASLRPLARLGQPVVAVAVTADGRHVVAGGAAGAVIEVDRESGQATRLSVPDQVTAVAVDATGRWLAVAFQGRFPAPAQLTLFDAAAGTQANTTRIENSALALAFADRDQTLLLGGYSGEAARWTVPGLQQKSPWTSSHTPANHYVAAFSGNGRWFGFAKYDVSVFDTGGDTTLTFPLGSSVEPTSLAIAPDATLAAVAGAGTISIVSPAVPASYDPGGLLTEPLTGVSGRTTGLVFVGRSRLVSASGSLLTLWDLDQSSRIAVRGPAPLPNPYSIAIPPMLAACPDGRRLAVGDKAGRLLIWDMRSHALLLDWQGNDPQYRATWSARCRFLVTIGSEHFLVWGDGPTPKQVILPTQLPAQAMAAAPDGTIVTAFDDGEIYRLDPLSGRVTRLAGPLKQVVYGTRFTADAGYAYLTEGGEVLRLDLRNGRTASLANPGIASVVEAVPSPSGGLLALHDGSANLVLWDIRQSRVLRRLEVGQAVDVIFNPPGTQIVVLTLDGHLEIWDVASGLELGTVRVDTAARADAWNMGRQTTLAFAPDGSTLWSATAGGWILSWAMQPSAWQRSVCATVGHSLSAGDWQTYVGTGSPSSRC